MQLRVVGQMESWRSLGRRGRAAVERLASAGRPSADSASAGPAEHAGPAERSGPAERGGTVTVANDNGSVVVTGERTGTVVKTAERTAGRRNMPEQSRVPSWLQTGAAWSWRLLLLALALY